MGYQPDKSGLAVHIPPIRRRSFATPVLAFLSLLAFIFWLRPTATISFELSLAAKPHPFSSSRLFHFSSSPSSPSSTLLPTPTPIPSSYDSAACKLWPGWRNEIPTNAPVDPAAAPPTALGSAHVLGGSAARGAVPATRRLGPFGHKGRPGSATQPWSSIRWGAVQSSCAAKHFNKTAASPNLSRRRLSHTPPSAKDATRAIVGPQLHTGRSAVVVRLWDDYAYSDDTRAWLRTLVAELALDTAGAYQVFLLVSVRNGALDLANQETHDAALARAVPSEFRDMAVLYNTALLAKWYPKVPDHSTRDQPNQALQIFSATFPEFDHIWQLEPDARLTGNAASMLNTASAWAATQPRAGLWERNAAFYIPALWPSHAAFSASTTARARDTSIWGPPAAARTFISPRGPHAPPRSNRAWGIAEDADLLTFAPLIDPTDSDWARAHIGADTVPATMPRRMSSSAGLQRVSRRLLAIMSEDQRAGGAWLAPEAMAPTWALLHGLKAVAVPHLVGFGGDAARALRTPGALDALVHRGPEGDRAGGAEASFVWSARQGLRERAWLESSFFAQGVEAQRLWFAYTNGSAVPVMLLHPVRSG